MPIRTKGSKPPLFCVHGEPLRVAQALNADYPVYGLSHVYHSDYFDAKPESIEGLAKKYLSEVREVCPHGPYQFCGYSAGGLIAYEMARQLIAEGESVANLILVEPTIIRANVLRNRVANSYKRSGSGFKFALKLIKRLPKSLYARTRSKLLMLSARVMLMLKIPLPERMRWLGYLKSLGPAMRKYKYEPLKTHSILLYSEIPEDMEKSLSFYWKGLLGDGCEIKIYPGVPSHKHFMYEPHLTETVSFIQSRLVS